MEQKITLLMKLAKSPTHALVKTSKYRHRNRRKTEREERRILAPLVLAYGLW